MTFKTYMIKLLCLIVAIVSVMQTNFKIVKGTISDVKDGTDLIGLHLTYFDYRYRKVTNQKGAFQIRISEEGLKNNPHFSFHSHQIFELSIQIVNNKQFFRHLSIRLDEVHSYDFLFKKNNYLFYDYQHDSIDMLDSKILYRIRSTSTSI